MRGYLPGPYQKLGRSRDSGVESGERTSRLTIVTVTRGDASGTTFAFTKHLDAISPEWMARYGAATVVDWPGDAMRVTGNENVAGRIQHAEGSIGCVGYEFAHRL